MKKSLIAIATLLAASAQADVYPSKVITMVVPFSAGGPTDRVARDLAESMRKSLGNAVIVVDNVTGAGGVIGANKVAKSKPDGYTILVHNIAMATIPTVGRYVPFKVDSDFEYLGMINEVPMTLVGRSSLPAKNFKDLLSWIKLNKDKSGVSIGNAGIGSASHLCGLLFELAINVNLTALPYKGTAPAMTDLIGGQIDLMCDQTTNTMPHIEGKKIVAFAATTARPLSMPSLKNLPTLQSMGLKNFDVTNWHGLYAPKGTPTDVIFKLNSAMKSALKDPEFIKKQESYGASPISDKRVEPGEHKKFVLSEIDKWEPLIKDAGVMED